MIIATISLLQSLRRIGDSRSTSSSIRTGILDLALTRFLLNAMVEASTILATDTEERTRWSEIRDNLAPYPAAKGPYGEVWLDIAGAPVEHIYNVPITLAPIFPGEQVGLGKGEEHLEIGRRTARTIRLEGGNDLVSQSLIRAPARNARPEWFKSQVEYGMLPDGVSNDRVRQSGGRYGISTDFDFIDAHGALVRKLRCSRGAERMYAAKLHRRDLSVFQMPRT